MGEDTLKKNLLRWAKSRALKNNIPFTLTFDDINVPHKCPALGIPLFSGKKVLGDNSPSLDRIVPDLGYVPGNVIVISHKANTIKSTATWCELQRITDFYGTYIRNQWMPSISGTSDQSQGGNKQ